MQDFLFFFELKYSANLFTKFNFFAPRRNRPNVDWLCVYRIYAIESMAIHGHPLGGAVLMTF